MTVDRLVVSWNNMAGVEPKKDLVFLHKYQWPLAACLAAIIRGVRLVKGLEIFKNGCWNNLKHI